MLHSRLPPPWAFMADRSIGFLMMLEYPGACSSNGSGHGAMLQHRPSAGTNLKPVATRFWLMMTQTSSPLLPSQHRRNKLG